MRWGDACDRKKHFCQRMAIADVMESSMPNGHPLAVENSTSPKAPSLSPVPSRALSHSLARKTTRPSSCNYPNSFGVFFGVVWGGH